VANLRRGASVEAPPEAQMKQQRLHINRGDLYHNAKIIPETHILLGDYAKTTNITIQDTLHRLLLDFFTEFHHFEDPNKLVKGTHKAMSLLFANAVVTTQTRSVRSFHDVKLILTTYL
jgi:hypothetical protein